MRLGYIEYLNCYPFYYHMFEKKPLEKIEIIPDYPSGLNAMILKGELDMSPISSGAYPDVADRVVLLRDFCLSSVGYIESVNLVSKIPIENLNGKTVGITSASATSVNILKVLLGKYYGVTPEYVVTPPFPDIDSLDAALLIGNEAMMQSTHPVSFKYDLGELWLRKTGYPAVFAVFAVQKEALEPYKDRINSVIKSYRDSLNCMKSEKQTVVAKAKERYPDIVYDIDYYFSLFRFDFTDNLKAALLHYFKLTGEMGLLKKIDRINFF